MSKKGFTIIELLVVVVIIGLLSTIGVTVFTKARKASRDAKRIADLKEISTAVEMYYNENGAYPFSAQGNNNWAGECPNYGGYDMPVPYIQNLVPTYISILPQDPKFKDTDNRCYLYRSNGTDYMITANQTMETICGSDPSNACNPPHIQALDRPTPSTEPTIAVYSSGARLW